MATFDEPVWQIYAWISTALLSWGASLLFEKCSGFTKSRCGEGACKPTWYPSTVAYFVVLLAMDVVLSVAAYLVWVIGGWVAFPWALSLALGALFLVAAAHFLLFTWFLTPFRMRLAVVSSIVMLLAAGASIAATVFFFQAGQMVSFALGIIYSLYVIVLAIANIIMARFSETHVPSGKTGCGCVPKGSDCALPTDYFSAKKTIADLQAENARLRAANAGAANGTPAAAAAAAEPVQASMVGLELPPHMRHAGYALVRRGPASGSDS